MADISTELARILSAIYGEDVRGSIHDAIEKINDVSEVVLTTGTAVTGPSSSSEGFYDNSLYLNTDNMELWKCTGVNTWVSQGTLKGDPGEDGADGADGNGIASITKTATSGLVDTYTITYTDGTTTTFNVTNGEDGTDGINGNRWYRGTGISGKAVLPTVYTDSGVADANSGDMFLNPTEGAVYSCVTGGVPSVATWQYEMTLSGGGSGGTNDYVDLINKPQINGIELNGNLTAASLGFATVATSGAYADVTGKPSINGHTLLGNQTGADLGLASSSDIPTVDQTYNATSANAQSGTAVASAISGKADSASLATVATSGSYNDLTDKPTIPTVNDGQLTIQQNDTNKATFTANQSGNATANIITDEWTATATVSSNSTVTFTGLDDSYGYELYCQNKLIGVSAMTKTGSGTSVTLKYTVTGAASGDVCKLRILK